MSPGARSCTSCASASARPPRSASAGPADGGWSGRDVAPLAILRVDDPPSPAGRLVPGALMPREPNLRAEWALWQRGAQRVVGVDEVGTGALCAPVLAAAVLVRANCRKVKGVRDSKTLSVRQREAVVGEVRRRAVAVGVGAASVAEIERLNIYHASHLAMERALRRIGDFDHVLVDGRKIVGFEQRIGRPYTAIVDGDASSYAIACASVVAKVTRDRLMVRLAARYPGYGWEHNAGYRTRDHVAALRALGPTPFHRRAYAPVRAVLEGDQLMLELEAPAGEGERADEGQPHEGGSQTLVLSPALADALAFGAERDAVGTAT